MRDKGFLILAIVGAGFIYFVFNFVHNVQNENLNKTDYYNLNGGDDTQKEVSKFYTQDVTGSDILDLSGVPLDKAKEIWSKSPTKDRIMKLFPNFKLMKDMIKLKVAPSDFRDYLLQEVDNTESDYLAGSVSSYEAKKHLSTLE